MNSNEQAEAVARFLVRGGPVAANVSTERAQECLDRVNDGSGNLRERFGALVTMSRDTHDFNPHAHFWGKDGLVSVPQYYHPRGFEHGIIPATIRQDKSCFTQLHKGSNILHDVGLEIGIGYERTNVDTDEWIRIVHIRHMDDKYANVQYPGNKRALKSKMFETSRMPVDELATICPQAVADVRRAFTELEASAFTSDSRAEDIAV